MKRMGPFLSTPCITLEIMVSRLTWSKRFPIEARLFPGYGRAPDWACTTYTAHTPQGETLLARNFDWYRHPAMLLFTDPPDGYASASMVDLSYLGFDRPITPGDTLILSTCSVFAF